MAQKRMISQAIFGSAKFLKMPLSAQALYAHLVLRADDDGVVEAFSVMRMTGNNEDDLRILAAKQFVKVLDNDELIIYITNWLEQNSIRADRKIDSRYQNLLLRILPEVNLISSRQRSDRPMPDMGRHRTEQIRLDQYRTATDARAHNTVEEKNQDVNSVDNSNIVAVLCKKLKLSVTVIGGLIAQYGREAVEVQLEGLMKQKDIHSSEAWLRAALRDEYSDGKPLMSAIKVAMADPNCPDCGGTGKSKRRVADTKEEIIVKCKCCK